MNTQVGDFISFNEMPDNYEWGLEGKVLGLAGDGSLVVQVIGTSETLYFHDLYGSWDSTGRWKVEHGE